MEEMSKLNTVENQEDSTENKAEAIGTNPPSDDQEKIAKKYIETIDHRQVLVHHYTESKAILNDLQEQLNSNNMGQLKDKILEREKDVQNLQSRINGLDQAAEHSLSQLTQESKEKYLVV